MKQTQWAKAIRKGQIEWSAHALRRMLERGIDREAVKAILCTGEMIEHYHDDNPFPSALIYGIWKTQPLHVIAAFDRINQRVFCITAYCPDFEHFEPDFKNRRKK